MWKFNPFTPKEPSSLEGHYVNVGNVKVLVRNAIAEGGFSCVYLARDAVNSSKQYALKHMICNDEETLELVVKEISVMKMLRGHPNVVTLVAHSIVDMGRTKEALLVMDYCENSLVTVLDKRGAAYFQEKQILSIFRDVCNAVFTMHCQSPPIAHRDLKAENILLGLDGTWKLCDFGSSSTKHKRFDRPEERGIEEDNIRKHTTPAYRAPEMWDLYRKEVISEKVDIWALGCLLYRICYFKSAFDGESKLQILNGNYCIPEVPKYSSSITRLIKDMLEASPNARPDITQVWFRVNEQLPVELQKHLPDGPATAVNLRTEGIAKKTNIMPQRNPPPPREQARTISPQSQAAQKPSGSPVGAFWTSHHAPVKVIVNPIIPVQAQHISNKAASQNEPNTSVADFDTKRLNVGNANSNRAGKEQEEEVHSLKEQLKQANLEKADITSKYEKLSTICDSQRLEIQELKKALATATTSPQPNKTNTQNQNTPNQISPVSLQTITLQKEKLDAGIWELEQAMFASSSASPDPSLQPWQTFTEEPKPQPASNNNQPASIWPNNGHPNFSKPSAPSPNNSWALFPNSTANQASSEIGTDPTLGWAGF